MCSLGTRTPSLQHCPHCRYTNSTLLYLYHVFPYHFSIMCQLSKSLDGLGICYYSLLVPSTWIWIQLLIVIVKLTGKMELLAHESLQGVLWLRSQNMLELARLIFANFQLWFNTFVSKVWNIINGEMRRQENLNAGAPSALQGILCKLIKQSNSFYVPKHIILKHIERSREFGRVFDPWTLLTRLWHCLD